MGFVFLCKSNRIYKIFKLAFSRHDNISLKLYRLFELFIDILNIQGLASTKRNE